MLTDGRTDGRTHGRTDGRRTKSDHNSSSWAKLRWAKNRIYSKQVLHLTSTPPLSKIRSAGILSIWQKETTSSYIWTAIKFEYFDLTKIRFFEIPWFFPDFQQNFKFPDFSLQGFFFHHFPCFSCFPECVATLLLHVFSYFDLQVTLILATKLPVNWPFGSGEKIQNRFPWRSSWISD